MHAAWGCHAAPPAVTPLVVRSTAPFAPHTTRGGPPITARQVRYQAYQDALAACAPLLEGKVVLDVGCGLGALSMMAAEVRKGGMLVGRAKEVDALLDRCWVGRQSRERGGREGGGGREGAWRGLRAALAAGDGLCDAQAATCGPGRLQARSKHAQRLPHLPCNPHTADRKSVV